MSKNILLILSLSIVFAGTKAQVSHRKYSKLLKKTEKQLMKVADRQHELLGKEEAEKETPDLFWIQEYLATMNPETGRPTPEVLLPTLQALNNKRALSSRAMPGTSNTAWVERGPNNVGGRTRALTWDPTDPTGKKVWAGGVTGGLWYNNDITNANSKWVQVSNIWSNITVSAMAWDPNSPGTAYVGTGEGFGTNASTSRGFGVWKTTDSGKTWNQLSSTTNWNYINDIVVRNENGSSVVYVAVDALYHVNAWIGLSVYGLYRSTNGGTNWTNVIPNIPSQSYKFAVADIEIGADNRLWVGTRKCGYGISDVGGGRVLYSDNGTNWTIAYTHTDKTGRVEVGVNAKSAGTIYALVEVGNKLDAVLLSVDKGVNWTTRTEPVDADQGIPATDFTRGQAWYDLILAVDPNDSSIVYAGGINVFRSTNRASSWTQISKWAENANMNTLNCPYVHADIHAIEFKKGSSSTCMIGTDGGVFYSNNISAAATSPTAIAERNNNYNVTQYYCGDMAMTGGSNLMIAGAQDNGSHKFTTAGMNAVSGLTGGDGGYCFISESNSNKQITSYVYNQYYYTLNNWSSGGAQVLINDGTTGRFINPAEWDDNGQGIFSARSGGTLYRRTLISSPGTLQNFSFGGTAFASALNAVKLSNGKTRLFVGTEDGKLYVTDDAWAATISFSDKSTGINAGYVSDIYSLRGGDTLAVVLANYGGTFRNIYISTNGGTSWTSKEGNLPDMPVWSIVLNPNNLGEAVIGTEVGVYGTTNIFATTPVWSAYTVGMGAVKIRNMEYRPADKMLLAVTHGRGLFTSDAWAKSTPIVSFGVSSRDVCTNQSVNLLDSTLNDPTSWAWTFNTRNFVYTNGTDSTMKAPRVRFTKGGTYSVTLLAKNAVGSGTLTRSALIKVTDTVAGTATAWMSKSALCAGDTFTMGFVINPDLAGSITNQTWKRNQTNTVNTVLYNLAPAKNDSFSVQIVSNKKCVSPASFTTNTLKPAVNDIVNASAKITAGQGCSGRPMSISVNGTNTGANPVWTWYVNGIQTGSSSSILNIASPFNGDRYYATVNVVGPCVRPSNMIKSDTITLLVKQTPAKLIVNRNFDTMKAVNQGSGVYRWFNGKNLAGTGRLFRATANGSYRCVYEENGCASDTSDAIVFNSLRLNDFSNAPMLFPNPAVNVVQIPGNCGKMAEIYTMNGVLVSSVTVEQNQSGSSILGITSLKSGAYFIVTKTENENNSCVYRFVKQ